MTATEYWYEERNGNYFCKVDSVQLVPIYPVTGTFHGPTVQCPVCKRTLDLNKA
jgi:hypothetical protein